MTKFAGVRHARLAAVTAVVAAAVIATGSIVASSLAAPARFRCSPDSVSFTSCASPVTVSGLAGGGHTFSVEAVYGSGSTTARPARYAWQVVPAAPVIAPGPGYPAGHHPAIQGEWRSAPRNFHVGADLPLPLYPGTSRPLNLTFTNPYSAPITIPRGAISASNIIITTRTRGCASSNFAVPHGLTAAVTIPAGRVTPVSLSRLGVPKASWPVIEMIDTKTNQDACQDAKLTLTYAGIEATG